MKANANTKKQVKEKIPAAAKHYPKHQRYSQFCTYRGRRN